jgi:hypothetical protein
MTCGLCGRYPLPLEHEGLTAEECAAIAERSGLVGKDSDGVPIVAAVLIRRREFVLFSGMRHRAWADVDWPVFACPWSAWPADQRPILMHGPAYRAATGETHLFKLDADGGFKLEHRVSHCPVCAAGGYWLRYVSVDELPRRLLQNAHLGAIVTAELGPWAKGARSAPRQAEAPR